MIRKIPPLINCAQVMEISFPKNEYAKGLRTSIIFLVILVLSAITAIKNNGVTIPSTYTTVYNPPQSTDPGKAESANTPARTGAQHVVAMPENIPNTYTEPLLCFL